MHSNIINIDTRAIQGVTSKSYIHNMFLEIASKYTASVPQYCELLIKGIEKYCMSSHQDCHVFQALRRRCAARIEYNSMIYYTINRFFQATFHSALFFFVMVDGKLSCSCNSSIKPLIFVFLFCLLPMCISSFVAVFFFK